ncbi:hydrogenase [Azoarcus indigens]|uniref:Hydrogenase expression/formation protein n=1 Tax=Azoarcus indigens TaxID=29545 RepID=A0A4R6DW78_9RHOO|nr:hydrogenase [Azoarcus indigens]NMG65205.1 hydrogenase [Azoarcus indigens]TDN49536.1 hydrogenase-1 operon protein HyaE [Azoarcus indigens]
MNDAPSFGISTSPFEQGLQRLRERDGFTQLEAGDLAAFAAATGDAVILLTDDPVRCPEAWDMVVVLPEALKSADAPFRRAYAAPAASREIAAQFGISRYPALLFLRGGQQGEGAEEAKPGDYVGAVEGMRDWRPLVDAINRMLATPAARRPGIGIPVRTSIPTSCH